MDSFALAGGLSVQSPSEARHHTPNKAPSGKDLDSIELADHGNLVQDRSSVKSGETQTTARVSTSHPSNQRTPNEMEGSDPPTPVHDRAATVLPSFFYPAMNKWRILAACFTYFGNGLSDSAPGAVLPYIERYYGIDYAVVSLIWITNAVGFIVAACFTDLITSRLGRAKSLMCAEACMIAAYVVVASTAPFPAIVVAYAVLGFGNALNLALNNVFCANLADATVVLGLTQGSYGIGGIVAPIAATTMVSNGILWSRFYIITIGVRVMVFFAAGWSFWGYEKEDTTRFANDLQRLSSRQAAAETDESPSKLGLLGRALKNKTTIMGALFIFAYQGAEVSESGWFISYLINYRHGNPARVGYVTSGFWAGITAGRFLLTHLAHRVGEKTFVYATTAGVVAFQLLAWLIPNVIGDAVSVAVLGFLLGPVYPCAMTVFTRALPSSVQMTAISFISSAGSSGGAVVPFLTGLIAQSAGTFVLHPICIGSYFVMLGCWMLLPKVKKMAAE